MTDVLQVPTLSTFNLRDNPIADDMEYPMMVLRALPSLVELDSNPISSGKNSYVSNCSTTYNQRWLACFSSLLCSISISVWGFVWCFL